MLRPKASTSGGQSEGRVGVDVAVAAGGCEEVVVLVLEFVLLVLDLAISNQELTEVQERQGLPSGPRTTPLGRAFGLASCCSVFSRCSAAAACAGEASRG